jgi:hypothetical protein
MVLPWTAAIGADAANQLHGVVVRIDINGGKMAKRKRRQIGFAAQRSAGTTRIVGSSTVHDAAFGSTDDSWVISEADACQVVPLPVD